MGYFKVMVKPTVFEGRNITAPLSPSCLVYNLKIKLTRWSFSVYVLSFTFWNCRLVMVFSTYMNLSFYGMIYLNLCVFYNLGKITRIRTSSDSWAFALNKHRFCFEWSEELKFTCSLYFLFFASERTIVNWTKPCRNLGWQTIVSCIAVVKYSALESNHRTRMHVCKSLIFLWHMWLFWMHEREFHWRV